MMVDLLLPSALCSTSYIRHLTINQLERITEPLPGLQLMRSFDEGHSVRSSPVLTLAQLMVVTMIFTDAFSSSLHLDMKKIPGIVIKEGEDPLNRQIWWNLTPPPQIHKI